MLKFTEISEENRDSVRCALFGSDEFAKEAVESFDLSDPDVCYGVTRYGDCMLVRVFDLGRYMFVFPIELTETADLSAAVLEVAEYARREELPLTFVDVPTDGVAILLSLGFRHLDVDREDDDSYRVRIKSECELLRRMPELTVGALSVSELSDSDAVPFAELCRDPQLSLFWGYDYREDSPDADDGYFLECARAGFASGTSMTLALKKDGDLIGEIELFAFDGRGECEFAVRIAKKHQGRGFGSLGVEAAIAVAERMAVSKLSCDVMKENIASVSMIGKYFEETESTHPDRRHFELEI